jgi:hypothetical protein
MADTEDLVKALSKNREVLERLLETTQDMFILQALEAGITAENVRALVGVDKVRVNRVSTVRRKDQKK